MPEFNLLRIIRDLFEPAKVESAKVESAEVEPANKVKPYFHEYNTDTGDRDFKERKFPLSWTEDKIKEEAIRLRAKFIVQTSRVNEKRPGHWYIKGIGSRMSFEEIKEILDENKRLGKHTRRKTLLIEY